MNGRFEPPEQSPSALRGFDDFDLSLGDIMRGERATMGKSLLDVQRELKIKASYIAAIENTDPSAFDTPGFIAGYVRSYARYLGLDPEWAFKTFCQEGEFQVQHGAGAEKSLSRTPSEKVTSAPAAKSPSKGAPQSQIRDPFTSPSVSYLPQNDAIFTGIEPRAIGSIMVLSVLLGGLVYGGWTVLQEVQKVQFTPVEQTPGVLSQLDPLAEPAPGATVAATDLPGGEDATQTEAFSRLYRPEALDVPVLVSRDGPIAAIDPETIGTYAGGEERTLASRLARPGNAPFAVPGAAPGSPTSGDEPAFAALDTDNLLPPPQVVEASSPSVSLLAVRPSWVRVRAADGTVVFEKILDAGEEFAVPLTEAPATLRAGNAGSLYFKVNGMTYGPAGDGPSVVSDVALSPDALQTSYSVARVDTDSDLARFVAVAEALDAVEDTQADD